MTGNRMLPGTRLLLAAPHRVSAVYAVLFSIACLSLVYLPQWFVQVGLTTAEVGSILAIAAIVKVPLTLLIGSAADMLGRRKRVLLCVSMLLFLGMPVLFVARDWFWLCVSWALLGSLMSTCIPLTDSIAVTTVQRESVSYGRMRMWGSIFFLLTSLATGWLISDRGDQTLVVLLCLSAFALCVCVSGLPDYLPNPVPGHTANKCKSPRLTFLPVLRLPGFVVFLVCAAILMASHAALYSLSTVYWSAAGISLQVIGLLWAVGVVAEIGFFFIAGTLIKKWDPWQLLLIAGLTGLARWIVTATVTEVPILIVTQSLHAVTFTFTQLAVVTYIGREVPEELTASAQSLYDSCALGVVFGVALFVSGQLSQIDTAWSFIAMAVMSAVGASIAAFSVLRWKAS